MEYIERQSIALDLRCLLKTVHIVFSHEEPGDIGALGILNRNKKQVREIVKK